MGVLPDEKLPWPPMMGIQQKLLRNNIEILAILGYNSFRAPNPLPILLSSNFTQKMGLQL